MRQPQNRTRRDRKHWQTLVEQWRSSGANAKEFARTHGLSATSLYYWSSVLSRAAPAPLPKLLPVRMAAQIARSSELELWVGAAHVRFDEGTSPAYVGALARVLLEATAR
jgi:transposase-like protein